MSGPRRRGRRCDHSNLSKNFYTRACKKIGCKSVQECEHRPMKYNCLDCNAQRLCRHGSRVTECVDCGGIGICIHRKRRYICKECGGGSICPHMKQRSQCSECQSNMDEIQMAENLPISNEPTAEDKATKPKKRRLNSNDNLGSSKVINSTPKLSPKESEECDWKGLCNHQKPSFDCIYLTPEKSTSQTLYELAGPSFDYGKFSICIHKRLQYYCTECGGAGLCIHNNRRYECFNCEEGPSVQMKRRQDGLEGDDSSVLVNVDYGKISICKHKMLRYYCLDCEGGGICSHKIRRDHCTLCH